MSFVYTNTVTSLFQFVVCDLYTTQSFGYHLFYWLCMRQINGSISSSDIFCYSHCQWIVFCNIKKKTYASDWMEYLIQRFIHRCDFRSKFELTANDRRWLNIIYSNAISSVDCLRHKMLLNLWHDKESHKPFFKWCSSLTIKAFSPFSRSHIGLGIHTNRITANELIPKFDKKINS